MPAPQDGVCAVSYRDHGIALVDGLLAYLEADTFVLILNITHKAGGILPYQHSVRDPRNIGTRYAHVVMAYKIDKDIILGIIRHNPVKMICRRVVRSVLYSIAIDSGETVISRAMNHVTVGSLPFFKRLGTALRTDHGREVGKPLSHLRKDFSRFEHKAAGVSPFLIFQCLDPRIAAVLRPFQCEVEINVLLVGITLLIYIGNGLDTYLGDKSAGSDAVREGQLYIRLYEYAC